MIKIIVIIIILIIIIIIIILIIIMILIIIYIHTYTNILNPSQNLITFDFHRFLVHIRTSSSTKLRSPRMLFGMPGPEQLPGVCRSLGAFRTESGDGMLVSEYLPGRVPVTPLLLLVDVGYCWLLLVDKIWCIAFQILFNFYSMSMNMC